MSAAKKALRAATFVLCVPVHQPAAAQDWRPRAAEYKAAALQAHGVLTMADEAVYSSDVGKAELLDGCSRGLSSAKEVERRFPDGGQGYPLYSWRRAFELCGRNAAFVCDDYGRNGSAFQSSRQVLAACSGFLPAWAGAKSRG